MIRSKSLMACGVVALAAFAGSADASTIQIGTPADTSSDVEARARWANTGQEGILFTPGNPNVDMNPSGAPVWQKGLEYSFQLSFDQATGTSTWNLDFSRDGSFAGVEVASATSASLVGRSFGFIQMYTRTNDLNSVEIRGLTINGTLLGDFANPAGGGNNATIDTYFGDTSGGYGDILITGSLVFDGTGGFAQERPVMGFKLGGQAVVIPLPTGAGLAGIGLGLVALRRRR